MINGLRCGKLLLIIGFSNAVCSQAISAPKLQIMLGDSLPSSRMASFQYNLDATSGSKLDSSNVVRDVGRWEISGPIGQWAASYTQTLGDEITRFIGYIDGERFMFTKEGNGWEGTRKKMFYPEGAIDGLCPIQYYFCQFGNAFWVDEIAGKGFLFGLMPSQREIQGLVPFSSITRDVLRAGRRVNGVIGWWIILEKTKTHQWCLVSQKRLSTRNKAALSEFHEIGALNYRLYIERIVRFLDFEICSGWQIPTRIIAETRSGFIHSVIKNVLPFQPAEQWEKSLRLAPKQFPTTGRYEDSISNYVRYYGDGGVKFGQRIANHSLIAASLRHVEKNRVSRVVCYVVFAAIALFVCGACWLYWRLRIL